VSSAVLRTYARSLVEVALEGKFEARVEQELESFARLYREHGELRSALENPAVPVSAKLGIVGAIAGKVGLGPETANFLRLLVQNHRIGSLEQIRGAFREALDAKLGILSGEVFSAAPLPDGQKTMIEQQLARATGRQIRLGYQLDPDLIAGVKIHLSGVVYDASVKKQLEEIRRRIV
jgi:F-type H+-transporting ATPase subunit delta